MSQEKVLKTLESLGLAKLDAQVYIFLGKKGPQKASEIAKALKIRKQRLYDTLRNLESKGIVSATLEHPAKFSALQFEKALDLFLKAKIEEAQRIEGEKAELFSYWRSISLIEASHRSPKFSVLEGRKFIYPRLKQMVLETKNQLSIVSTVSGLMRADQFGLLEAAFTQASKTNAKFRFITELSERNLNQMNQLTKKIPLNSVFEGRTSEIAMKLTPRMLIRDDEEAAFFISQEANRIEKDADDVCLWTDSSTIVNSFAATFENLWQNSTEIKKRISEIETGKPAVRTCVINDPVMAKKKYEDAIDSASKEIIIVTSSAGLVETCKQKARLKESTEKGISIRIMAPIIRENLEAGLALSHFCRVRHATTGYLGITIVDGEHLFEFKPTSSMAQKPNEQTIFEHMFYSNDLGYVERTNNMLDEIWRHATAPSNLTVGGIAKPQLPETPPVPDDIYTASRKDSPYQKMIFEINEKPLAVTEEYVLNKIINAKRKTVKDSLKGTAIFYGSEATAVIRTPKEFNLPEMIFIFFHFDKESSYGEEDCISIHSWLKTTKGYAFVPVAFIGDNPKSLEIHKSRFVGTPDMQNCHILKKKDLQIQVHGNTLYASWAVPIQLFPKEHILPAGAVLVEGYGKLKTVVSAIKSTSGAKSIIEGNGFDAFVTYFHPASKYCGPGTDGTLGREIILTAYPPPVSKAVKHHK